MTFSNLHSFAAAPYPDFINSDGALPYAGLVISGNTLYGTADYGGSSGNGTVFRVNTDGTGFTNLHVFSALVSNTNSDGARPYADLVLMGDTLYGAASVGGASGSGTVFTVKTNGAGFATLYNFTATTGALLV